MMDQHADPLHESTRRSSILPVGRFGVSPSLAACSTASEPGDIDTLAPITSLNLQYSGARSGLFASRSPSGRAARVAGIANAISQDAVVPIFMTSSFF